MTNNSNNNNAAPTEIYAITNQIKETIEKINNEITEIDYASQNINEKVQKLNSYNGKKVKYSYSVNPSSDGNNVATWKVWNIEHCDEIISMLDSIKKFVTEIDDATTDFFDFVSHSQVTADAISNYINEINGGMDSLTQEQRQILLDTIKDYKAEDEYSAMNGNYTGIKPENEQWWIDDAMYARYDVATGAVLVYQIVNGQEVGMGWVPADKWIEGVSNVQKAQNNLKNLKNLGRDAGKIILGAGTTVLGAISGNNISSTKGTGTDGKWEPGGYIPDSWSSSDNDGEYNAVRLNNGTIIKAYGSGKIIRIDTNGSISDISGSKTTWTGKDGSTLRVDYNTNFSESGDSASVLIKNGKTNSIYSDGNVRFSDADGSSINTFPDGTVNTGNPDGTVNITSNNEVTYVSLDELSDSVKKELYDYPIKCMRNKNAQEVAYNNLSPEAKDIVDGRTVILSSDPNIVINPPTLNEIIDNREDIVIPKGKSLYVNGEKLMFSSGETFSYDSETGKYRGVMSNGNYSYGGYDIEDMKSAEIK